MECGVLAAGVQASINVTCLVRFPAIGSGTGKVRTPRPHGCAYDCRNSMLAKYETYEVRQWDWRVSLDGFASLAS